MRFLACNFCQSLGHQINNCLYRSNNVLPTHTLLTNHRPYLVSTPIQNLVPNIQILVYSSTLPNVACKELIIPPRQPVVLIIENVMEQNPVGFPNSMYFHVKPYTPYFGFNYRGVKGVPTMWPPMSDPLANPTISPKQVMGIVQIGIVTNCGELLDKNKNYSMK